MEFFIYAHDEDNAIEVASVNGDEEFETAKLAKQGYDPDFHSGKKLFRILIEEVKP